MTGKKAFLLSLSDSFPLPANLSKKIRVRVLLRCSPLFSRVFFEILCCHATRRTPFLRYRVPRSKAVQYVVWRRYAYPHAANSKMCFARISLLQRFLLRILIGNCEINLMSSLWTINWYINPYIHCLPTLRTRALEKPTSKRDA